MKSSIGRAAFELGKSHLIIFAIFLLDSQNFGLFDHELFCLIVRAILALLLINRRCQKYLPVHLHHCHCLQLNFQPTIITFQQLVSMLTFFCLALQFYHLDLCCLKIRFTSICRHYPHHLSRQNRRLLNRGQNPPMPPHRRHRRLLYLHHLDLHRQTQQKSSVSISSTFLFSNYLPHLHLYFVRCVAIQPFSLSLDYP